MATHDENTDPIPLGERSMLDAVPYCVGLYAAVRDASGRIADFRLEYANRAASAAAGESLDRLIGRKLSELPQPRDEGLLTALAGVVQTGEPILREAVTPGSLLPCERPAPVELHATRHGDGILATWREHCSPGEERFRIACEAVCGIIYEYDCRSGRVERSQGLREILGYHPEEVPNTADWWWSLLDPDEMPELRARFEAQVGAGDTVSLEYRMRHARGHWIEVWDRARVLRDGEGRVCKLIGCTMDVTERVRAERSLRESEERLWTFLDNTPSLMGVVELPPDNSDILHIVDNGATEAYYGRDRGGTAGKWANADLRLGDEVVREWTQVYREAQRRGTPIRHPYRYTTPDPSGDGEIEHWLDVSVAHVGPGNEGRERFCYTAMQDTERKRAEESLRESEHRLQSFLDNTPSLMGVVELPADNSDILHVLDNAATERFFGVEQGGTAGRWAGRDLGVPAEVISQWNERYREAQSTGRPCRFAFRFMMPDDRGGEAERWLDVSVTFIGHAEQGRDRFCYTATDDTDRQRTEHALRESEQRFRSTFASAPVGIAHVGLEGRWLRLNEALCRITGYPPEELETLTFADITHPDDLEADWAQARRLVNGEISRYSMEKRYLRRDGAFIWVNLTVSLERDDAGRPLHYIAVVEDISERKWHEQHMRTVTAELNHRVKNTLAVIQSIAAQTARRAPDLETFSAGFEERLRSIASAHSLLTRAEWEGADLREIMETEIPSRSTSEEQYTFAGPPVKFRPAAALAMHMVIHELTTNACKYGGLRSERDTLEVAWSVNDDLPPTLELTWTERCARPIAQPDGLGFGTRLVEQLVEYELRGEYSAEFREHGYRCRLDVPLERQDTPRSVPTCLGGPPASGPRALIVEDHGPLAMQLREIVETAGFEVLGPAATLSAATALAVSGAPTVALLDVNLNGVRVYPLARALRREGVPFALISGYDAADLPEDLRDAILISKPASADSISSFLRQHV